MGAAAKILNRAWMAGVCRIGRQEIASITMSLAEMVERRGWPHLRFVQSVRPDQRSVGDRAGFWAVNSDNAALRLAPLLRLSHGNTQGNDTE
ncbi:hypothetical protein MPL1032_180025 [Mesorhizobium plurifarium]|uniref:Uncharacterized protein n=1 Tax=Mesorhizobium plurifarium TaxID=69974 RepID=A0A0K2VU34_MESPL|nr:hypothetical protein MPL1032_180025 [Mesorhizobium plurifarium]